MTKHLRQALAATTATVGLMAVAAGLGSASAAPFVIEAGPNTIHFTNWETKVTAAGDELVGLIRIDQIFNTATGNTIFSNSAQEEIVGYFKGLILKAPGFVPAPGSPFAFTGGELFLYRDSTPNFNPSFDPTVGSGPGNLGTESPFVTNIAPEAAGPFQAPIAGGVGNGVTDGALWAHIVFDPGLNIADPTATLSGSIRATLPSDDGFGSPAVQGDGQSFLSIDAGEVFNVYNTNGFNGGLSDFRLDNTFFITNGVAPIGPFVYDNTTNGWDTHSDDPVKGILPEPMTIGLIGMGLLGLGVARRRKA